MDWYGLVFEMIDLRSFSNLWYWIAIAVTWSTASHWILGVPFDMVQRAARYGGQAETDLHDMVRINVNRIFYVKQYAGMLLIGFTAFLLTTLVILGFLYDVQFAQAVFLIAFPMSLVIALNLRTATIIRRDTLTGEPLRKRLIRHRLYTQMIGVVAIFVSAMWGMYQNLLVVGPLGG